MAGQEKNGPRKTAVRILDRIDEKGAFAEPLLDAALSRDRLANIHDRRLLTQLVYGTLRMRGRLDWIISRIYKGDMDSLDVTLRNILRVGLYQFLFMDRIPDFAVVDESVETAKGIQPRGAGLVNAVLRTALRQRDALSYPDRTEDPAGYISVFFSHPRWLVEKWIGMLGTEETLGLCRADNENPPLMVRVNRLKMTREELERELSGEGYEVRPTAFSSDGLTVRLPGPVRGLRHFREGYFQIQDEASQLVACLVDPEPGERIMDVCSGVGIKTTHLAERMQNRGRIVALDVNAAKGRALKGLARRLGITILESRTGDARMEPAKDFQESFDRILVDAPCSGLGTLRRNPEIKWRMTPEEMRNFPSLQKEILTNAVRCLKKGGLLVYSTCTIAVEENDGVVRSFLTDNRDVKQVRPPAAVDGRLIDDQGFFRTFPHRHGTDGFFGALFRKA